MLSASGRKRGNSSLRDSFDHVGMRFYPAYAGIVHTARHHGKDVQKRLMVGTVSACADISHPLALRLAALLKSPLQGENEPAS